MKIASEMITKQSLAKKENIWAQSVSSDLVFRTYTPVLADKLNAGENVELFPICKSYIAGAQYHPIKLSDKAIPYALRVGDWLTLNFDKNNEHDSNAITYRLAASVMNADISAKKPDKLVTKSGDILYGGQKTQYRLMAGFVPVEHQAVIKSALEHYNKFIAKTVYSNMNDYKLSLLTHCVENVAAKVVYVTYTGTHYNYYLELYTDMNVRKFYLERLKQSEQNISQFKVDYRLLSSSLKFRQMLNMFNSDIKSENNNTVSHSDIKSEKDKADESVKSENKSAEKSSKPTSIIKSAENNQSDKIAESKSVVKSTTKASENKSETENTVKTSDSKSVEKLKSVKSDNKTAEKTVDRKAALQSAMNQIDDKTDKIADKDSNKSVTDNKTVDEFVAESKSDSRPVITTDMIKSDNKSVADNSDDEANKKSEKEVAMFLVDSDK